jgi:hypothetical protein
MKLSYIFSDLLNEDFKSQTQKFISQNYEPEIVKSYIERFKHIRDNKYREALNPDLNIDVPVEKRFDIDAYKTFQALEIFVDYVSGQRPVKTTMSKQNDVEFTGEAIYNKNGIEVFYADNPRACIKYKGSIPYGWCIARNDSTNMFNPYRFGPKEPAFYFVKDVEATQEELASITKKGVISGTFENKYHFIVIQVPKYFDPNNNQIQQYTVTSANNDGDIPMSWDEIIKINPKLAVIKDVLKPKPLTKEEKVQYERFKNGLSDDEFKKLSYEDKRSYLEIYPKQNQPITTNQFLLLPDDLKNLYVSYGIGLNDKQFDSIKNNPKLVKRYAQISDRKLDLYFNSNEWNRSNIHFMYSELIVLKDDRISEYLNSLNRNQFKDFVTINGVDKLEILEKYTDNEFFTNYGKIKTIVNGLNQGEYEAIESLSEMLPDEVSVSYDNYSDKINFESSDLYIGDSLDVLFIYLKSGRWDFRDDHYFDGWSDGLDNEYNKNIENVLKNTEFVTVLRKNRINPTVESINLLLEKFEFDEEIKEYIDEIYTDARNEGQIEKYNELSDKFNEIITYENYRQIEIAINMSNFIGSFVVNSDILTTDGKKFDYALKSLLIDILEQAKLPTSTEALFDMILDSDYDIPYEKITEKIIDSVDEIIHERMQDNDEFKDNASRYNTISSFEETLKGLGKDVNTNEIENDLVRMEFDRSKVKSDGSIYTTVTYKSNNNTYDGYVFIKDIPSYFQNYKLFEAIENFKKLIK